MSSCDAFRDSVVRRTSLGLRAQRFTDEHGFLPDSLTNVMVRSRLAEGDCRSGFVLDGYPLTMGQVGELDDILNGEVIHSVLVLSVRFRALVKRLAHRAEREGEANGTLEAIRRQEQFAEHTCSVVGEYTRRRVLTVVDGAGASSEVTARLTNEVGSVAAT